MRSFRRRWRLDEVFVRVNGVQHYLWRALDHEGEVPESYVSKPGDKKAAQKFLGKLRKRHGRSEKLANDGLRFHGAARQEIGAKVRRTAGRWANNRAENSRRSVPANAEKRNLLPLDER